MNLKTLIAIIGLSTLAAPVAAHHSPASYDTSRRVSIEGTIISAQFRNPHGKIRLRVAGRNGAEVVWEAETSASNLLRRRGWVFSQVRAGSRVTLVGHPNKTVANDIYLREIRFPNGTVFGDQGGSDQALD